MATSPEAQLTSAAFVHSRLDDLGLDLVEFRLYGRATRRAGGKPNGLFYESVSNMAKACRVRIPTVRSAMKRLIARGLIVLTDSPPGRTWTYRVTPIEEWPPANPVPQTEGVPQTGVTPPVRSPDTPGLKQGDTPPVRSPTKVIPLRSSLEGDPLEGGQGGARLERAASKEKQDRTLAEILPRAINGAGSPAATGDWNGMNLNEKALWILGSSEVGNCPRWLARIQKAPDVLEEILDKMHADLLEGNIIKNRGAYAERLWQVTR
jgi:hypothetical protein